MTRVSRRSHFCPVSHNKALSSRELDVHRATRHEMHKLGSWHNGTYVSGNAQATQCHKVTDWLAVVGENLSCALHRCCRRYLRCCRNLLKSTLLPPLTSPAPPAPPLRPDHLQRICFWLSLPTSISPAAPCSCSQNRRRACFPQVSPDQTLAS